ncbi:hypothetical protein EsDP_00006438 [Epichloe bromicola]|uniref:MYND-type domain-containing protein n=1 Tax=Epichloe bromicola TaxID=79588 RepID=A0ABQ0CXL4_9HYPO
MACLITGQGLSPRACAVCRRRDGLLRCSACEVTFYCSRDHQVSHRPAHKKSCTAVKRARENYLDEDQALRSMSGDSFVPDDVFRNGVGRFWGIWETRPYMRARYGLVDALLLNLGSAGAPADVVQVSLDHLQDMMRLCRSDNMGLRDMVPSLLIRLGRDQDAYDFVKWYATTGNESDYNWGDMSLPFLDVKDADVLEPVDDLRFELSHATSVLLIKTRLLLDLEAFQAASCPLAGGLPAEILHLVQDQLVGPMLKARPELLLDRTTDDRLSGVVEHVKAQVAALFKSIDKQNGHFWPAMLHRPESAIAHRPDYFSPRSREEAILVIGYTYPAWAETRGAIELMKKLKTTL